MFWRSWLQIRSGKERYMTTQEERKLYEKLISLFDGKKVATVNAIHDVFTGDEYDFLIDLGYIELNKESDMMEFCCE